MNQNQDTRIIRRPAVELSTGLARSTIYRRIKEGLFPRPVNLGGARVGWVESEIAAINRARIAGKSDDAIKSLLIELEGARQMAGG